MRYIDSIIFPDENRINFYFCGHSFEYPWDMMFYKKFKWMNLKDITILYGNNGSGKSTILQLIAQKINAETNTNLYKNKVYFDGAPYVPFNDFVNEIIVKYDESEERFLGNKKLITSQDVFKKIGNRVIYNRHCDEETADILKHKEKIKSNPIQLSGLGQLDDLKNYLEARKLSKNKYVAKYGRKKQTIQSNGETALDYFYNIFENGGVFLLDEPENCLSPVYQLKLVEIIKESVKFFDCQFIIATHSPIILSIANSIIYNLDKSPVISESWNELENVKMYYNFFKENSNLFE